MIDIPDFDRIKADISALYDECLATNTPFHRKLDLFIVPESLAIKVQEATGIDINGHWVCIDNFGILHTLEQHGNPISEAKRGQVAIEKEDFLKMLEVFLYPDEIISVGKTNYSQKPVLQFVRQIEDKIYGKYFIFLFY